MDRSKHEFRQTHLSVLILLVFGFVLKKFVLIIIEMIKT